MPHDVPYDIVSAAHRILERLSAFGAAAVFFVVGRLAEKYPELIREISQAGHEIGLHGYDHDDLASYDAERLGELDRDMARVEALICDITGAPPVGFRAPYLLSPRFYRLEVYDILAAHGYRWVSNREIRYPIELLRPDRMPLPRPWRRVPAAMITFHDWIIAGGNRLVLLDEVLRSAGKMGLKTSTIAGRPDWPAELTGRSVMMG